MRKKHLQTLAAIFRHPVPSGIRWDDAIAMLVACGAEFDERSGSETAISLHGDTIWLHQPHPGNEMDKGAVASLRKFLDQLGIKPQARR